MSALEFSDVTFTYAVAAEPVLRDVAFEIPEGAFALVTGATGSGKSTLLRLAKPELAPAGARFGVVRVFGQDVLVLDPLASARALGYVFQSPDEQMVCDTVWHEMALGLENLGVPEPEMRRRVAETATFLGMGPWFRDHVAELSGGRRQVLALASVLAMRPRVLLLDEPTSMLDPVSEQAFLALLFRANHELGMTVVVATHAPEAMVNYATCAFVLEEGAVREVPVESLAPVEEAVPGEKAAATEKTAPGEKTAATRPAAPSPPGVSAPQPVLELDDVWFRYDRDAAWVLRAADLALAPGEIRALLGANGCGKSTLLRVAAGVLKPRRGRVRNACAHSQALLPQDPRTVLACETVCDELLEWAASSGRYGEAEVAAALERLGLASCPDRHPYDLSGGQQQLLALEKLLLVRPRLLLLDEPTKGLDRAAREEVCARVSAAAGAGCAVLIATHDVKLVHAVAQTASLVFDGSLAATEPAEEFLASSWLYHG